MKRRLLKVWLWILTAVLALLAGGGGNWYVLHRNQQIQKCLRSNPIQPGSSTLLADNSSGCVGKFYKSEHSVISGRFTSPATIQPGGKIEVIAFSGDTDETAQVAVVLSATSPSGLRTGMPPATRTIILRNDGQGGDRVAGDVEWYGSYTCLEYEDTIFTGTVTVVYNDGQTQSIGIYGNVKLDAAEAAATPEDNTGGGE